MAERLAAPRIAGKTRAGAADATGALYPLTLRIVAYLIDSAVLFAFTMVFAILALINIFIRTDFGEANSVPDSATWTSVVLVIAAIPLWYITGVYITRRHGQTIGQYLTGLALAGADGRWPSRHAVTVYWLALHPLMFHPVIGGLWATLAWATASLTGASVVFAVALMLGLLCFASPLANLIFALMDPGRRCLHDRVAGLHVFRLQ